GWKGGSKDVVDEGGVFREAAAVFLRQGALAATGAVFEVEPQQLAQQGGAVRFGDVREEVLEARSRAHPRQQSVLEAVAHRGQAPGQVQGQLVRLRGPVAHGRPSSAQSPRINRSLRATVRAERPSLPPISSTV